MSRPIAICILLTVVAPTFGQTHAEVQGKPIFSLIKTKFQRPRRLAFDTKGNVLIVDSGSGAVYRRNDAKTEVVVDGLNDPSGVAVDKNGNIYVSTHAEGAEGKGTLVKINPKGKKSVVARNLTGPKGMAFDAKGDLYVASFEGNAILKMNAKGKLEPFVKDVPTPAGLVFDHRGNLYAVNSVDGTVTKITTKKKTSVFARGLKVPSDITIGPSGQLLVCNYTGNEVSQIDSKGIVLPYAKMPGGTIALLVDGNDNLILASWDLGVTFRHIIYLDVPIPPSFPRVRIKIREKQEVEL